MSTTTGIEIGILYSSASGSVIFALIYTYLFWRHRVDYLKSFAIFWGLSALALLAAASIYIGQIQPAAEAAFKTTAVLAGLYLLKGAGNFLEKNLQEYWFFLGFIALAGGTASFYLYENWTTSLILIMAYLGLAYLSTGIRFIQYSGPIISKITGWSAVIFAVSTFLYPLAFQQEWFLPAGSVFLGGVGTLFGLGLVGAHYEELQNEMRKTRENYQNAVETQKELKEKLEIREQQYHTLFSAAPIGLELKDCEGNIIEVNEKLCEITGYEKGELIGENLFDTLVPTAYEKEAREDFNEVLAGENLKQIVPSRTKSGEIYYANLRDTRVKLPGGQNGVLTMRTDVSERLEAERKLIEEKEKFQSLAETSPFGLVVYREEFEYVNTALEEMTGYSREEMLNMKFWKIVAPEHREIVKERGYARLSGEEPASIYEFKLQSKEGEKIWVLFSGTQIEYEGESAGIGTLIDISERKKAEEQLKQVKEEQEILLENVDVQVWYLEDTRTYGAANQAHADFLGLDKDEIQNKSLQEIMPEEKAEIWLKRHSEVFKLKKQIKSEEYIENGEGEERILSITRTPMLNEEGEVKFVVCSALDITELKEKEERLKYLSYHDDLTDLYNRSYLEEEIRRLDTERQLPLSMIMCDVNGMKIVNDTYGHEKGDELLIRVAEILQDNTRYEDIVARWAGDEFVIFLPRTGPDSAEQIKERIEEACAEAKFGDIPISLGIGFAAKEDMDETWQEVLARADKRMYKDKLTKIHSTEYKLVENMLNTLGAKSAETKDHAVRMNDLAYKLGEEIGLSNDSLNELSLLATLHDIGKVAISEEILTKPDDLTDEEWKIIKEHPARGYTIAKATEEFAPIAKAIMHHHENWNGGGYPEGLEREDIPLLSRIIAIVDAYDVMTTGRPYKEAMDREKALEEIERCAGEQFDPELAEKFVNMVEDLKFDN